jgi:hypothetical protein
VAPSTKDWMGASIVNNHIRAHDRAMPNITLELEPGADPIQGRIGCPDGTNQPFWGWLELIEVLGRLADEPIDVPAGGQEGRSSAVDEEER